MTMNDFIKSFSTYCKTAQFESIAFWAFPLCTIVLVWLLTTVGLKIFSKRKKMKTVFLVNRAWMISSLIAAAILIGIICFFWSKNYFSQHPWQLSLLISLTISMLIPVFCLSNLRNYYTREDIKELINQPKTKNQLEAAITFAKRAFSSNKFYFLIPLLGFSLLLFYLYKGTNLISLVYDNSGSMTQTDAIEAVSETFDNLDENNEITLTTLEGFAAPDDPTGKPSIKDLIAVSKYSALKGGNVVSFNNPMEAKGGLSQASNPCFGSPICEGMWKTFLFIKETKPNETYKNKVLIVLTDGMDNIDESLKTGNFFFDDEGFSEYFPAENVFIIDYSQGTQSGFMQRCETAGCDIYPAENNKQAYLAALDNALQSFKNNWYLIYWTIIIVALFSIIGLIIQPKKIV
jgi:hypothetical protein